MVVVVVRLRIVFVCFLYFLFFLCGSLDCFVVVLSKLVVFG